MRRSRKIALALLTIVGFALALSFWHSYVPEPVHNGIGLSTYLTGTNNFEDGFRVSQILSAKAAPYLANEMRPQPLYELAFRLAPKLPAAVRSILPNQSEYQMRRARASRMLYYMRTNAAPALPTLLGLLEKRDPIIQHNCLILVGTLAPGTQYEERALQLLLKTLGEPIARPEYNHRKAIYSVLGNFTIRLDELSSLLAQGMREHANISPCLDSLLKIGPPAIPALKEAVKFETNIHIRPADLALEKIEQAQKERSQKQASLSSP